MLSRIAEDLFWIGRYVERAEDTARILDVQYHAALESGTSTAEPEDSEWASLIDITGNNAEFRRAFSVCDGQTVPRFLTFHEQNPSSIYACVQRARENARGLRDQISSEMWEMLNMFFLGLRDQIGASLEDENLYRFCREVKARSHLFQGITDSTMLRGDGWHFIQAGKFLERAEKTSRILDVRWHGLIALADGSSKIASLDIHRWTAILRSVSAYEAYLKTHTQGISPRQVADFLILYPTFPRSIRFSIDALDRALRDISGNQGPRAADECERLTGRLQAELTYTDIDEVMARGLRKHLRALQDRCNEISSAIAQTYFALRTVQAL